MTKPIITPKEIRKIIKGNKEDIVEEGIVYFNKYAYPLIKVNGILVPQHIYLWEKHNKPIPKGYVIHHKNKDKKDNRMENLELMKLEEHTKLHHTDTRWLKN